MEKDQVLELLKGLIDAVETNSLKVNGLMEADSLNCIGDIGVSNLFTSGYFQGKGRSADPDDPADGFYRYWVSDGTDSGNAGDVMIKITAGGVTKTFVWLDFSSAPPAGETWADDGGAEWVDDGGAEWEDI